MPVFRDTDAPPAWCELEGFEIVRLSPPDRYAPPRRGRQETLFVCAGAAAVSDGRASRPVEPGAVLEVGPGAPALAVEVAGGEVVVVHSWGRWEDETGGAGVFTLDNSLAPRNAGDPAPYLRQTDFDRHYHDCDEYWILAAGRGRVVTEGVAYEVGPGDCVATRMGDHHDFPAVHEPVLAVYLETTLRGRRRRGHLWEHTHGPPDPS